MGSECASVCNPDTFQTGASASAHHGLNQAHFIPCKRLESFDFQVVLGSIKWEHWAEMGKEKVKNIETKNTT